jgi:DUF1680 family protein
MWSFLDYRYRLTKAIKNLDELHDSYNSTANSGHPESLGAIAEQVRLRGKKEGVQLALSYFDEMTKEKGFQDAESDK